MRAQGTVINPEQVEIAMTFTMSLADWESIAQQMGSAYPAWKFTSAINDLTRELRAKVYVAESK
jgi:hypothetical protein